MTASPCVSAFFKRQALRFFPVFPFERPVDELTARLSYVNFNGTKALAASETIPLDNPLPEDFIERICEDTIEGVRKIAEWVSEK